MEIPPIDAESLALLLPDFLPRQRWYGAADRELVDVEVVDLDVLLTGSPCLVWALAEARFEDGEPALYQIPIGQRPLEDTERFLEGKGRSFLGDYDTAAGPTLVYDALVDPDLSLEFLHHVAPGEEAKRVRPLLVEQSNTSVVYDERLIMKVFRRIHDGPNPDAEVTEALAAAGFRHISAPVATWRQAGRDLAVVREFLSGGTDGWHLAMTSLRDLYDSRLAPAESGGDFAPEARRLGEITAEMHVALSEAFGVTTGDAGKWADAMEVNLGRVPTEHFDSEAVRSAYARLRHVSDPGPAIRVHGDFHLGQAMRTDAGWFMLDFEGEPAVPLAERRAPSSPLRDVAGMLRSFHYASLAGLLERGVELTDELVELGSVWEERASAAFMDGYRSIDGIDELLPGTDAARHAVLDAFLLAKAVYEVGYEASHRPAWLSIPLSAVERVLEGVR